MNFAQLEYPVFLATVVCLVAITQRLALTQRFRASKLIVLAASIYFYAYWDYRFLGLLIASTLWDWWIGFAMGAARRDLWRRCLLSLSIFGNLGLLGFFKYYNFFIESAQAIFERWGFHPQTLAIVLPIGISFYTFQTLSYSIDVYRRHLAPCRSLLDFAIYVTFFPQLVAGPIVRASEFLPQLRSSPCVRLANLYPGLVQILRGLIKKVLIADHLATIVDPVFASPELFHAATVMIAVLAYAGQIYGDFSGYSDIAVGSARLLGFSLPENFAHPYLATSMSDFWRRWHITLSTWLRDYLYIPLGGNRRGRLRTYINLMITMILGGLWHGAAWNFVAWGAWHGIALSIERAVWSSNVKADITNPHAGGFRIGVGPHRAITILVVLVGWMLFRTTSFAHFGRLAESFANWHQGLLWLPPLPLVALVLLTLEHAVWASPQRSLLKLAPHRWQTPWLVGFALAALALFAPGKSQPFVYFQF